MMIRREKLWVMLSPGEREKGFPALEKYSPCSDFPRRPLLVPSPGGPGGEGQGEGEPYC